MKSIQSHKVPGIPKFFIVRPMIKSENISAEDQKKYQLGKCMLLYLIKHSRQDIANTTMELSKANNGAIPVAVTELLHLLKYVLDTKKFGVKL